MRSIVCLVIALVISSVEIARADDFLKSSPGELSASHASLDNPNSCDTCHEPDRSVSIGKCLGCHEHANLKRRIDANQGFHASANVKGRDCKLCHQEHRGRGFDLMGWKGVGGMAAFDHAKAGWPLQGKHAQADCARCHTKTNRQGLRKFVGTDRTCGTCHAKENPHGNLRAQHQKCERCHSESTWRPPKSKLEFNHDDKAQAAMKLEGSHASVACVKCHPKASFKLAAFDNGNCAQCHKSPHDGQLFGTKKCESCHSPALRALREVRFDHKKQAGYALAGKHAQIDCTTCHTKALGTRKPTPGCENCHAKDNKHGKRFEKLGSPPACTTCHSQRAWKSGFQFNHGTSTKFDLTAKHATTACRSCHRGKGPSDFERFEIANGCMSCHQHQKAHGGKFENSKCLTCHAEGGSKRQRKEAMEVFHGEGSKFPLRNGHAGVQCQMCHVNDVYQSTPRECGVNCHEDTLHRNSLGQECSRCHEPGRWPAVRFDHAEDTKWPLKGKHADIKTCDGCHPSRQYTNTPKSCGDANCHRSDDVHKGALGAACEKCHREDKAILFRHNRDSKFKLENKHEKQVCATCHKTIAFKPTRSDCFGCHPEPKIHKGRYGTTCDKCHSTKSFTDIRAQHDVGNFSLTGAHDRLDCAKCHPKGEALRGSGNLCVSCHKKDDIHQNALSPRCGECHTQRSFAPARFDHTRTGCSLKGLHATLPCADCHKRGNYGALSPMCVSCHRQDALRVKRPDHATFFDCGRCHNPTAWVPDTGLGAQSICR
jgi:hypothetical protein